MGFEPDTPKPLLVGRTALTTMPQWLAMNFYYSNFFRFSAGKINNLLSPEMKKQWASRLCKENIVLVDWFASIKKIKRNTPIWILRDILMKVKRTKNISMVVLMNKFWYFFAFIFSGIKINWGKRTFLSLMVVMISLCWNIQHRLPIHPILLHR